MKKISTLLFSILVVALTFNAQGTTHTVTVQNFSFSPATLTVLVGDTILWTWVSGTHNTTSTSVPAGAATWAHNMNSSFTSFSYPVTAAGTYNYECTIHFSQMQANFTATVPSDISPVNTGNALVLSGVVASGELQINYTLPKASSSQILLFDLAGNEVKNFLSSFHVAGSYSESCNIGYLPKGLYFLELRTGDMMVMRKIAVE